MTMMNDDYGEYNVKALQRDQWKGELNPGDLLWQEEVLAILIDFHFNTFKLSHLPIVKLSHFLGACSPPPRLCANRGQRAAVHPLH